MENVSPKLSEVKVLNSHVSYKQVNVRDSSPKAVPYHEWHLWTKVLYMPLLSVFSPLIIIRPCPQTPFMVNSRFCNNFLLSIGIRKILEFFL